jgi:hypothetical protein
MKRGFVLRLHQDYSMKNDKYLCQRHTALGKSTRGARRTKADDATHQWDTAAYR